MYLFKPGKLYDFMAMRRKFLFLSIFLLGASVVSLFAPGPRWGTDFKGGTEIEVAFKKPVDAGKVRESVESIKGPDGTRQFEAAEVIAVPGAESRYMVRVQEVSAIPDAAKKEIEAKLCFSEGGKASDCTDELSPSELKFSPGGDKITARYGWQWPTDAAERAAKKKERLAEVAKRMDGAGGVRLVAGDKAVLLVSERDNKVEFHLQSKGELLMEGLRAQLGSDVAPDEPLRVEWIGPKAGAQLRDAALKSIGIAMFFIMAYIALRFDLRFAPGAVVALVHDVLISIGAMCLARKEITLSTVAAVLTILGYSLTDTVVVYDRIRENLAKHRGMSFAQIVNQSVSEMFGRTIITSATSALSMIAFLIFGTQLIKDFAFAMLVGIAVGTYSSIYIAAPFTEWIDRRFFGGQATASRAKPSRVRAQKRADAVV
jgi:preprotein translocase subunit SecF